MNADYTSLSLAALAFAGGHLILSHPLRAPLVGAMGEKRFSLLYSVLMLAAFAWMAFAYGRVANADPLWAAGGALRGINHLLMLAAFILLVASVTSRNPTLGPQGAAALPATPQGVLAITRHPMLWAFALWAAGHILANGDVATLIMAGGVLVLAIAGGLGIDAKKRRALGAPYAAFMARTSFVPFAAVLAGRARLSLAAFGWWRLALGVVLYGVTLALHPVLFGARAY